MVIRAQKQRIHYLLIKTDKLLQHGYIAAALGLVLALADRSGFIILIGAGACLHVCAIIVYLKARRLLNHLPSRKNEHD